ncbi:S-adenosyl-L-methionine-dependent methyltransferase [Pilobolus umbonatus]|nr:S-adenosyl-L-methionine-dependent methyltransferase [Pilobolus umbonatus]
MHAPSAAVSLLLHRMSIDTNSIPINELYYLMTGFMTVYLCFIEGILKGLFVNFMQLFSPSDSIFSTSKHHPLLWFYIYHKQSNDRSIVVDIQYQLREIDHHWILSNIDTIFSRFYTLYFLETSVQKHQKDHGQYYTPHSVIQFMWNKCITDDSLLSRYFNMPRVFDPCLGIGSFLCEFLVRLIDVGRSKVWDNPERLVNLLTRDIPNNIWGVEIDPFAYELCKINMMVHLFPIYERLLELNIYIPPYSIQRLRLFCNDTLKLHIDSNPYYVEHNDYQDTFEAQSLDLLRDPESLRFDYIVTNPPYMIRKTGFITQPDSLLYDETILGGKGTQAYLYFMWICLQRCDDLHGQICLITPSQWTVLEFAQHLREWIWNHCKIIDMYEFEPYKIWPKVQTDSLVFRICRRTAILPYADHILYLRYIPKKILLVDLLKKYQEFDYRQPNTKEIQFRLTSVHEVLKTKHSSFSFILPSTSCLDELNQITQHLPRLCDGELHGKDCPSDQSPLIWNRGPNTNPVYSLVVKTRWAIDTFGISVYHRWLKPCLYWNGKSSTAPNGGGKEGEFWRLRDPSRLVKKETSAAEAYWPFCPLDEVCPSLAYYSMIMVNKEDADTLKVEYEKYGDKSLIANLYNYLRDARIALQANKSEKEIAYCQYSKSGTEFDVKIVHPINCGYFTHSQPRPRFFVDRSRIAVTNQCIYFTIKPDYIWQDPDYFCGLLNCSLIQFFTKVHCCYDQQGRMRFFGRLMAYIPFQPPPSVDFMNTVALFVQGIIVCRAWLYSFVRLTNDTKLMEKIRNFDCHLTYADTSKLRQLDLVGWKQVIQRDQSLSSLLPSTCPWISEFVVTSTHADTTFQVLLQISSLFQYLIDQMVYSSYEIPIRLQLDIENELNIMEGRKEWGNRVDLIYIQEHIHTWTDKMIQTAQSFLTRHNTIEHTQ